MKKLFTALVLALACAAVSASAETVGRVLLAAGDVVAVRAGKALPLAAGMAIENKDTLRTGETSNLQVRFTDSSIMSLRENSELAIAEYRFSGRADGTENAFYRLLKGGLRTVTGLIGRTRHENYRIDTITAIIGIRGTHFALMSCQAGSCLNADGSKARDGLYGGVTDGIVAATTKRGEFRFGAGDAFFAASIESPVEKLIGPPVFLSDRLEGQKRGGSKQAASESSGTSRAAAREGSSGSEQTTNSGIQADSRASSPPAELPRLQVVTTQNLSPQGTSAALPATDSTLVPPPPDVPAILPPANGFVVVYPLPPNSPAGDIVFNDNTPAAYNNQNQLTGFGTAGIYPAGSLNGNPITDTGSLTLSNGQVITWGRWTGNTIITLSDGGTFTGAPVLFGTGSGVADNSVVGSLGGVATYTYAGGPRPVDAGGNVGAISSTTATIDFTAQTAALSLGINFPSIVASGVNTGPASFSVSGTGILISGLPFAGDLFGALFGTCTGSGCAGGTGDAFGYFSAGTTGAKGYEFAIFGGVLHETNAGDVAFLNAYLNNSFTPGTPRQTVLVAHASSDSANHGPLSQPNDMLTFSGGVLTAYQSANATSAVPAGALNSGTVVDTATVPLTGGGTLNWGRWTGNSVQVLAQPSNALINPPTGVQYIHGDPTSTLPTSGTFSYSYAGGPNPSNAAGSVGIFNGGAFSVAFGSTSLISVATPLSLTVGGVAYSVTSICGGTCAFGQTPVVTASLSGTCSGGACGATGSPLNGTLIGHFMGPAAGGLATAGNINSAAPTVSFAAGFARP